MDIKIGNMRLSRRSAAVPWMTGIGGTLVACGIGYLAYWMVGSRQRRVQRAIGPRSRQPRAERVWAAGGKAASIAPDAVLSSDGM